MRLTRYQLRGDNSDIRVTAILLPPPFTRHSTFKSTSWLNTESCCAAAIQKSTCNYRSATNALFFLDSITNKILREHLKLCNRTSACYLTEVPSQNPTDPSICKSAPFVRSFSTLSNSANTVHPIQFKVSHLTAIKKRRFLLKSDTRTAILSIWSKL